MGIGARSSIVTVVALVVILATAVVLRTVAVSSQGLWFDEGLTIPISRWPVLDMFLKPTDPTPALYYTLHRWFVPPDAPLIGIRAISIICGVISVGLIYVLGRISFGVRAGLIAAALLAVWTMHVDYSQEARSYSLLTMLTLISTIGVVTYLRTERRRLGLLLFGLGAVLAFHTHLTAAFFVAVMSLVVIGYGLATRRPLPELVVAFGLMALFAAPGLYRFVLQQQMGHSFNWLAQPDLGTVVRELASVMLPLGLWVNSAVTAYEKYVRYFAIALAALLIALGFWRHRKTLVRNPVILVILAYLSLPALIYLAGFVTQPIYTTRTQVFVIPGFILLIVGLIDKLRAPAVWAGGLITAYLASTLLFGLQQEQHNFRGAARYLEGNVGAQDLVLVCSVGSYPALRYHTRQPVGALTLAQTYRGDMVTLEGPLGSDPDWDEAYFRTDLRHEFDTAAVKPRPEPLEIPAGRVIWVVKAFCGDKRVGPPLEAALAETGATPEAAWRWTDRGGYSEVEIFRYVVRTPTVWQAGRVPESSEP